MPPKPEMETRPPGKANQRIKDYVDSGRIIPDLETGDIYSTLRRGDKGGRHTGVPHLRNPTINKRGYEIISLGNACVVYVHRIVAYAKYGDAAFNRNMVVHHVNNVSLDNRACNLDLIPRRLHGRPTTVVNPSTGRAVATIKTKALADEYAQWKFGDEAA